MRDVFRASNLTIGLDLMPFADRPASLTCTDRRFLVRLRARQSPATWFFFDQFGQLVRRCIAGIFTLAPSWLLLLTCAG
jgi:hypothetical protein